MRSQCSGNECRKPIEMTWGRRDGGPITAKQPRQSASVRCGRRLAVGRPDGSRAREPIYQIHAMSHASPTSTVNQALAAEFGLSADEYVRVLEIMGRAPTLTELGVFSVMWS